MRFKKRWLVLLIMYTIVFFGFTFHIIVPDIKAHSIFTAKQYFYQEIDSYFGALWFLRPRFQNVWKSNEHVEDVLIYYSPRGEGPYGYIQFDKFRIELDDLLDANDEEEAYIYQVMEEVSHSYWHRILIRNIILFWIWIFLLVLCISRIKKTIQKIETD